MMEAWATWIAEERSSGWGWIGKLPSSELKELCRTWEHWQGVRVALDRKEAMDLVDEPATAGEDA